MASRILGDGALAGGLPLYKCVTPRCLTALRNLVTEQKPSEYHFYGLRVLATAYRWARLGPARPAIFADDRAAVLSADRREAVLASL